MGPPTYLSQLIELSFQRKFGWDLAARGEFRAMQQLAQLPGVALVRYEQPMLAYSL